MYLNTVTDNKVQLSSKTFRNFWIYAVYNSKNELIFIWCSKIADIIVQQPLARIEGYDPNEMYSFYLLESYPTRLECERKIGWWMRNSELDGKMPEFNKRFRTYNGGKLVFCYTTGQTYPSATEAAKTLNLSLSALCNHLNKKPGFRTVKGHVFDYITGEK